MLTATNNRPRQRLERRLREAILQLLPSCDVCGRRIEDRFLRRWNDHRVCIHCINDLTREVDIDVYDDASAR